MTRNPDIHIIKQIFVNQFLIAGPEGLLLIDTGIGGNTKQILKIINQLGFNPGDLKKIIITHADGDHYGSLADIKKNTQAISYAHPIEADAIKLGISSRVLEPHGLQKVLFSLVRPLMKTQPATIDRLLQGGETFDTLGGLRVINTPGHTPGHLSLFSPSTGVLFAGDSITISAGVPQPSAKGNTWDMAIAEQSFKQQMDLNPTAIYAGHGIWEKT
jgi:glyoxylase-like metal-dependent hydrolase (beta-lactamase superfamily II)